MNSINRKEIYRLSIAVILIFLLCEKGVCEEKFCNLESCWQHIIEENLDVRKAARDALYADKSFDFYRQAYIPQITFSSTASSSEVSGDAIRKPHNVISRITVHEELNGGLSLDLGTNLNFIKNNSMYQRESDYTDIENFDFGISQSLYPYWLQKNKNHNSKDPRKELVILEKEIKQVYFELVKQSEIEGFTENFILLRQILRNIDSTNKYIDYYQKMIESLEMARINNGNALNEIFELEKKLATYEDELTDYIRQKQNLLVEIMKALAWNEESSEKDCFECIANNSLPEIAVIFDFELSRKYLELQQKSIQEEYILNKQKSAPFFSIMGSFPLHDGYYKSDFYGAYLSEENKNWSMSASFSLSPVFFNKKNEIDENYRKEMVEFEEKILRSKNEQAIERKNLENLILNLEKKMDFLRRNFNNSETLKQSMEQAYLSGACTQIDLLACQLEWNVLQNQIENCQDQIWFSKWLLKNREVRLK